MKPDLLVGIDVGKNGGFAWQSEGSQVAVERMPHTEADICAFVELLRFGAQEPVAYVEKVTGFITGRPQPASRAFTFGRNVGVIMGALYSSRFRIIEVTPQQWQKQINIRLDPKASQTVRKNRLKTEAQKLFPRLNAKITLDIADALLIFEAARRAEGC
jgi:hypothetical protein